MRSEALAARGYFIEDDFLDAAELQALRECLRLRRDRGDFAAAAIGTGRDLKYLPALRGDATCWLREPLESAERALLERLEALRLELNRALFLGLFDLELHYACYPPGARYARHVDQPAGREQRRVSLVLYLNPDWSAPDGGELKLYENGDRDQEVSPKGGRLVCFRTEGREHEVLPARRERLSLTGWFRVRDP
jgi:SM-20-related protein